MEQNFFEQLAAQTKATIEEYKKKSQLYTTKRTIAFILIVISVAAAYDFGHTWLFSLPVAILACFFYLIKAHSDLYDDLIYAENKYQVINNYLARYTGQWSKFPDNGSDFTERGFTQDADLNIIGPSSIYQYCSVARTHAGRRLLANRLAPFPVTKEELLCRQAETQFFIEHPTDAIHLQALNLQIPLNHRMDKLLSYLADREGDYPAFFTKISIYFPLLSMGLLVLSLFNVVPMQVPLILFSLQLAAALLLLPKTSTHITPLYRLNKELVYYYQLLKAMQDILPDTIGHISRNEIKKALAPIKQLGKLCVLAEMRHNFILLFLLNFLFLWDFHIVNLFTNWQKKYGTKLTYWLSLWNEAEAAISLSTIGHTRNDTVMPILIEATSPKLETENLHNVLIPEKDSIANSIDLTPSLNIITGSNMSGKTTWLRTLASACILTYAGAPVCATRFAITPMTVLTSIRVNDDMANGISTFYAELTRIKAMITEAEQNKQLFLVIDEIFKGTNSADRIICAKTALDHLTMRNVITMVSTHDFELCRIEVGSELPVNNYHFEEHYRDNELVFDYLMKDGPCQTTNAQFLLKMVGIG